MRRIPAHQVLRSDLDSKDSRDAQARVLKSVEASGPSVAALRPARIVRAASAHLAEQPRELPAFAFRPGSPGSRPSFSTAPAEEERAAVLRESALREQVRGELRAEFQQQMAQARQEGFDAGYAAAESALAEGLESHAARFRETAERLAGAWHHQLRSAEPSMAEMAFRLAEGILEGPLPDGVRRISVRSLSNALERLSDQVPAEVILHPVDLMELEESGITGQMSASHPGLRWIGDDTRERGDWEVGCDVAVIRRCTAEMLADLRGRMQLMRSDSPPLDD